MSRHKNNWRVETWEATLMPLDRSWLSLSVRNPRSSPPENDPFSQEMHLKILLLSRGLKLSNYKPGCRVSALHFFCEIDNTNDFLTLSSISLVLFSASYSMINAFFFTAMKRILVWVYHCLRLSKKSPGLAVNLKRGKRCLSLGRWSQDLSIDNKIFLWLVKNVLTLFVHSQNSKVETRSKFVTPQSPIIGQCP
jgi:hypothetical protein